MIYKSQLLNVHFSDCFDFVGNGCTFERASEEFHLEITFTINHKAARREAKFPNTSVAQILIYFGRLYNIHENVAISEG